MNTNWNVKIIDRGFKYTKDVYIFRHIFSSNKSEIMRGDIIETFEEGVQPNPSFEASPELLQEFANVLNDQGYKPLKGFLEGKIEATEKHLEDMRNLVFKK